MIKYLKRKFKLLAVMFIIAFASISIVVYVNYQDKNADYSENMKKLEITISESDSIVIHCKNCKIPFLPILLESKNVEFNRLKKILIYDRNVKISQTICGCTDSSSQIAFYKHGKLEIETWITSDGLQDYWGNEFIVQSQDKWQALLFRIGINILDVQMWKSSDDE